MKVYLQKKFQNVYWGNGLFLGKNLALRGNVLYFYKDGVIELHRFDIYYIMNIDECYFLLRYYDYYREYKYKTIKDAKNKALVILRQENISLNEK